MEVIMENEKKDMYWFDGFYDYHVIGSKPITYDRWQELLEAQSNGLEIITGDDGFPTVIQHIETVDELKERLINEINQWDKSSNVNSFSLRGKNIWLSKETRSSIKETVEAKQRKGFQTSYIWYGNDQFELNCDDILSMLEDISIYADSCNSSTMRHLANVKSCNDLATLQNYNYHTGYPDKLKFDY